MTRLVTESPPLVKSAMTSSADRPITAVSPYPLPALPTLPGDWGHKYIRDEQTGQVKTAPLTLLDLLYPTGEEIFVSEGWLHRWLTVMLEVIIRTHLAAKGWVIFGNVYVHWGRPGVPPFAPDVTAIPEGRYPGEDGSFKVGEHGPTPKFVIEVTSPHYLHNDLERKPVDYAALGVEEFLRIDMWSKRQAPWQLSGYRLAGSPFYLPIPPDAQGGVTFHTVNLRFTPVGRETVEVYDAQTGELLLPPEDWMEKAIAESKARAEAETRAEQAETRAEREAKARAEAEARLLEYQEKLRQAGLL